MALSCSMGMVPLRYSPPVGVGIFHELLPDLFPTLRKGNLGNLNVSSPKWYTPLLDEAALLLSSKAHLCLSFMKPPSSFPSSGLSSAAVPFLSWLFNLPWSTKKLRFPLFYKSPLPTCSLSQANLLFLSPSLPDFQKEWVEFLLLPHVPVILNPYVTDFYPTPLQTYSSKPWMAA